MEETVVTILLTVVILTAFYIALAVVGWSIWAGGCGVALSLPRQS